MIAQLTQNERRVFDLIWRKGPIPRSDIAEQTGLTTGSVTRITQGLLATGLLVETVVHNGARGNPMRPLEVEPGGAYAFGVSFSHRHMEVGLINLRGDLVGVVRRDFDEARPEIIAETAREAVESLGAESGIDLQRVLGIGFAVPGDFAPIKPFLVAHPYFPHLRNVDLTEIFSRGMPYSVVIENDCNSAALGERVLGYGQQYDSFISVFVCHGIGGGIILDGALHRGENGNAGGLHAFFPLSQPRPSGHDLFDTMAREGVKIGDFPDFDRPDALDLPGVRPWIFRAGIQLRDALSIVARLFDTQAIIIGGRLPPPILAEITEVIDDPVFCSNAALAKPALHPSKLGPRAGVIGAAAVVLYNQFLDRSARNPRDNLINGRRGA